MSKTNNLTDFLTDLANAIRTKAGTSGLIDPQDFASLIANLPQPLFKSLVDRSITTVTAEDLAGITAIRSYAFRSCTSLTSVTIPDSVTSIGSEAFRSCTSLTSVIIPDSVTSIENYAFHTCSSLTSVTIGNRVTSIENYAFAYCRSLTSVTIKATTPPRLSAVAAFNNTNNCPIYVPATSVNAYKTATNWSTYASRIQAIPTT